MDGTKKTVPKGIVLHTKDAEITNVDVFLWQKVLDTLIDPNLIVLFMSIGTLGLIVELWNPGLIFPAGRRDQLYPRPLRPPGAADQRSGPTADAARVRILRRGGLRADPRRDHARGSSLLRARRDAPLRACRQPYQVSLPAVIAMAAAIAGLMGLAAVKIVQARSAPVVTGTSELVGQVGFVRDALSPSGTVFVRGELWKARSSDGPLERGAPVRVDSIDDELVLDVEPAEQPVPVT